MDDRRIPTRALLACGLVGGPVYVGATLVHASLRAGFDFRQHRFSGLTAGELGWIHQANMVLVGLLTVLFALGARRVMQGGRGAVWGPRLIGLFGAAYVVGGLLTADPVAGFPLGTTPEVANPTWRGAVQNASRGASSILLIAVTAVFARRLAAQGRTGWAWLCGASFPLALAIATPLARIAMGDGRAAFAVAILATPWIVVTILAAHLDRSRRET